MSCINKGLSNKAECSPKYSSHVYCENTECNFDLGKIAAIDAVFKICMDGGYVQYDGEGGMYTECLECHCDSIVFET